MPGRWSRVAQGTVPRREQKILEPFDADQRRWVWAEVRRQEKQAEREREERRRLERVSRGW